MKFFLGCLLLLWVNLSLLGQPAQVSANDLKVETALIEATKEKFLRNTDKAVAIYQKILADFPNNDLADYFLSLIYQDSSLYEKAISFGQSAVKKSPNNIWFQQNLGNIYFQNNQYKLAIPVWSICITLDPQNQDHYQKLIHCFRKIEDFNSAIKTVETLEVQRGISPKTLWQKHEIYQESGNIQKAKKELLNILSSFPSEPEYFYSAAAYFLKNNDSEGAIKIYKHLLSVDPDASKAKFELNQLENKSGNSSLLSLKSFFSDVQIDMEKKRLRLLPEISKLEASKDTAFGNQLLTLCSSMETAHPTDALPLSLQGDVLIALGEWDSAMLKYKEALRKEETIFIIWEKYLDLLWKTGQSTKLAKDALIAWDVFPNNPLIPFYAAYGYIFQGKIVEAFPLIEEALLQSSNQLELSNHLMALKALGLSLQGEKEAASKLFASISAKSKKPFPVALEILASNNLSVVDIEWLGTENHIIINHAKAFIHVNKNLDLALKIFEENKKWGTPLFWEHLGDALLASNKKNDAESAYRQSMELGNSGKNIQLKLSQF